jgi:hypothetical protein
MTAIAIWRDETLRLPMLWAAADSKISSTSSGPLMEDGVKLLSLPIVSRAANQDGFFSTISYAHSVGYCFAGSTLMGQNGYLALAALLTNLVAPATYVPSMQHVAEYINRYLCHTFDDFKTSVGHNAMFEAAIFGHCGHTNGLRAFHLEPRLNDAGIWTLVCSEADAIEPHHPLYLGVDKIRMMERFENATGSAAPGRPVSRMPRYVIEDCIVDESLPSIGGDLQLAMASSFGFRALPLIKPRISGEAKAFVSYLGRELTPELAHLGEALVGGTAVI